MLYLGLCPADCVENVDGKVFGEGIHPEETSICKSAIAD